MLKESTAVDPDLDFYNMVMASGCTCANPHLEEPGTHAELEGVSRKNDEFLAQLAKQPANQEEASCQSAF